jgi:hypothetical protein
LTLHDDVVLEQASLVDKEMHIVKHCVTEQVPPEGSEDLALLGDNDVVAIRVASG